MSVGDNILEVVESRPILEIQADPPVELEGTGIILELSALGLQGPKGDAGDPGDDGPDIAPYLFTQASALAEWIINHNKGWNPLVTVLSPGGIEVEAQVTHMSVNQTRVYFSSPQAGSALLR